MSAFEILKFETLMVSFVVLTASQLELYQHLLCIWTPRA